MKDERIMILLLSATVSAPVDHDQRACCEVDELEGSAAGCFGGAASSVFAAASAAATSGGVSNDCKEPGVCMCRSTAAAAAPP